MQHEADGGGSDSEMSGRAGVGRPGEGTADLGVGTWGRGRGSLGAVPRGSKIRA